MALGPEIITDGDFVTDPYAGDWYAILDAMTWENEKLLCDGEEEVVGFDTTSITFGKTYLLQFDLIQFENITDYEFEYSWSAGESESAIQITGTFGDGGTIHITHNFVATDHGEPINFLAFGDNTLGGVYFKNVSFRENPGNLYLQTVQMVGSDTAGDIQTLNIGKSDDGTPIYYELETQEIEFANRAHLKNISDQVVVLTESGIDSSLEAQENDGDYKPIPMDLSNSVNIGEDVDLKGNYFTFKWSGTAKESSPIFNGIYLEKVTDLGITYE